MAFSRGKQQEAEQSAEGKGDRALPVRVDVLPIDLHLGAVMDHAREPHYVPQSFRAGARARGRVRRHRETAAAQEVQIPALTGSM